MVLVLGRVPRGSHGYSTSSKPEVSLGLNRFGVGLGARSMVKLGLRLYRIITTGDAMWAKQYLS